ncbi:hypothetical protein D3C79_355730 [compost metagenome]
METEQHINILQYAAFGQGYCTGAQFLSRLEDELQFTLFHQALRHHFLGGGQHHRGVTIVAAGMARHMLAINNMSKRVHIGTQRQHWPRFAAIQNGHDTGSSINLARDLVAHCLQYPRDISGGFIFFEPEFRDLMQVIKVI